MIAACPYCGVAMIASHLTPVRQPQVATSEEFSRIDMDEAYGVRPRLGEVRTIRTCTAAACIAKAGEVRR